MIAFVALGGIVLGWLLCRVWRAWRMRTLTRCIVCDGDGYYHQLQGHEALEALLGQSVAEHPRG